MKSLRKALIVANHDFVNLNLLDFPDYDFFGVDKGCDFFLKQNQKMTIAVGDFDSYLQSGYQNVNLIKKNCVKFISLSTDKSVTDLEYLLNLIYHKYDVLLCYQSGKRDDHFLANIDLLLKYPHLHLTNAFNYGYLLKAGVNYLNFFQYEFVSFFAFSKTNIQINNLKYEYDGILQPFQFLISNEYLDQQKGVAITDIQGRILCWHCRE